MTDTVKVTSRGVLVPRPLIQAWGDVKEVEIEQRTDAIIIKPKGRSADQLRARIVEEMRSAGLIEDLGWAMPPIVPADERARLAKVLGGGKLLSEIIVEERGEGV